MKLCSFQYEAHMIFICNNGIPVGIVFVSTEDRNTIWTIETSENFKASNSDSKNHDISSDYQRSDFTPLYSLIPFAYPVLEESFQWVLVVSPLQDRPHAMLGEWCLRIPTGATDQPLCAITWMQQYYNTLESTNCRVVNSGLESRRNQGVF